MIIGARGGEFEGPFEPHENYSRTKRKLHNENCTRVSSFRLVVIHGSFLRVRGRSRWHTWVSLLYVAALAVGVLSLCVRVDWWGLINLNVHTCLPRRKEEKGGEGATKGGG